MDHFVVSNSGQLLTGFGQDGDNSQFHGETIFNNAATGAIWVKNQVSLGAGKIILVKTHF